MPRPLAAVLQVLSAPARTRWSQMLFLLGTSKVSKAAFNKRFGQVLGAALKTQGTNLTFGDFKCSGIKYGKIPDVIGLSRTLQGNDVLSLVGELKVPWVLDHSISEAYDTPDGIRPRRLLGQPLLYMKDLGSLQVLTMSHLDMDQAELDALGLGAPYVDAEGGNNLRELNGVDKVDRISQLYGDNVTGYHAGLAEETRAQNLELFTSGAKPILAATSAIGAGFDFANVGYILYFLGAWSLTDFVQGCGRAARTAGSKGDVEVWVKANGSLLKDTPSGDIETNTPACDLREGDEAWPGEFSIPLNLQRPSCQTDNGMWSTPGCVFNRRLWTLSGS
ncbi:uncharacterized protein N7515_010013 [Penicillium bovifimosum]|uniref:Helicase C-terminal domain-containing protein n=1 Tax=Penicillium bovifimosum TaxID=126998 RepID=A0A9W9GI34_9EURO|nr:uncharacterized protein N7515_010013 [Penicillium bovifimosum]KAJ5120625.1 hypothetical protein N7515_010013 [Penicillium bovifimosum]